MIIGVLDFWTFILVFFRVTAMLLTMPVLSGSNIPSTAKIALGGLFALILRPFVEPMVHLIPTSIYALTGIIFAETAVGLLIGLFAQLIFVSLQIAGGYADTQMGLGMINLLNPFTQEQTSPTGQFLFQFGITIFLLLGGHLWMLASLADSYRVLSPGGAHFSGDMNGSLLAMIGEMFVLSLRIVAPIAGILLVIDVAFAIVARTIPQMNVFLVGMPLKILVGFLTIAFIMPAIALVVGQYIPIIGAQTNDLIRAMR